MYVGLKLADSEMSDGFCMIYVNLCLQVDKLERLCQDYIRFQLVDFCLLRLDHAMIRRHCTKTNPTQSTFPVFLGRKVLQDVFNAVPNHIAFLPRRRMTPLAAMTSDE